MAVLATPFLPTLHLPVRVARTHYEGADLMAEAPVTETVVREVQRVPGLVRTRTLRTTQGDVLLHETERTEVGIPWLLLGVAGVGWAVRRRRGSG